MFYVVKFKLFSYVDAFHDLIAPKCDVSYHKNVAVLVDFAFVGNNSESCADLVTTQQCSAKFHRSFKDFVEKNNSVFWHLKLI